MEEPKDDVAALVAKIPDADDPEKPSKFTAPGWEVVERTCEQIFAGGRESILRLIGLVRDPAEQGPRDFKAVYLLHCMTLFAVRPGKEAERRLLAETMASQLGGDKPAKAIQGLLIRELQAAGGKDAAAALGKVLLDDELGEYATQALLAIRTEAAPVLRGAFAGAKGKARMTLAQALGVLRDAGSAGALREALTDGERGVRMAAAWALASIGDPGAAAGLTKAAAAEDGWERTQAAKACLLLAERLRASGKNAEARGLYTHLRDTRQDPADAYIREAAERGLAAIGRAL